MESALIVGGDSAIGVALIGACREQGIQVHATSRRSQEQIFLDLAEPMETWGNIPPANTAFICAAITNLHRCETEMTTSEYINVMQTKRIIERCISLGMHICFFSSNQVFDGARSNRKTSDIVSPRSQYGLHKAMIERWLLALTTSSAVLRLTKVFDGFPPIMHHWQSELLEQRPIEAFADLFSAPIPIKDVVAGAIKIAKERKSGIFQLSGREDVSFFQAAMYLAEQLGVNSNLIHPTYAADKGILPQLRPLHTTLESSQELLTRVIPTPRELLRLHNRTKPDSTKG